MRPPPSPDAHRATSIPTTAYSQTRIATLFQNQSARWVSIVSPRALVIMQASESHALIAPGSGIDIPTTSACPRPRPSIEDSSAHRHIYPSLPSCRVSTSLRTGLQMSHQPHGTAFLRVSTNPAGECRKRTIDAPQGRRNKGIETGLADMDGLRIPRLRRTSPIDPQTAKGHPKYHPNSTQILLVRFISE